MKKVLVQEVMDLTRIVDASFTPLKMLNPVAGHILNFRRKASLYRAAFNRTHKSARRLQGTDVSFKRSGYKLYTMIS